MDAPNGNVISWVKIVTGRCDKKRSEQEEEEKEGEKEEQQKERAKASFRVCHQFYSSAFTLSIFTSLCQRPHLIDNQGNHRVIHAQQTGA